jgi:hypothetical protein
MTGVLNRLPHVVCEVGTAFTEYITVVPGDPVQQYGDAYTGSIFVTDPASALQTAQRQLREKTGEDLRRYCIDRGLNGDGIIAIIEAVCGVRVPNSASPLQALTDEQVALVWAHVDATGQGFGNVAAAIEEG